MTQYLHQSGFDTFLSKLSTLPFFNPAGRLLATGDNDKKLHVFDVSDTGISATTTTQSGSGQLDAITLEPFVTFEGHTGYGRGAAFSPDSERIASGGQEGHVMIDALDPKSPNRPLHDMSSEDVQSGIFDVEFLADGTRVVSASKNGNIAIWTPEAAREQLCIVFKYDQSSVHGVPRSIRIDPLFPEFLLTELGALRLPVEVRQGGTIASKGHDADLPHDWLPLSVDREESSISYGRSPADGEECMESFDGSRTIYLPSDFAMNIDPFS